MARPDTILRIALRWKFAEWTRSYPGRGSVAVLLLLPLGFFLLPAAPDGLYGGRAQTLMVLLWLGCMLNAVAFGKSSAQIPRETIWTYQKSIQLADWMAARWLLDVSAALVLGLWWGLVAIIILVRDPAIALPDAIGVVLGGLTLLLLSMTILFALSAVARNAVDFFIVICLVSVLRDFLVTLLPSIFKWLLMAFPPIMEAIRAGGLLMMDGRTSWLPLAAHVAAYAAGCTTIASLILKDRAPPA